MTCKLKDNPDKGTFILKYINLNELTKNKAAGSEREAKLMAKERVQILLITRNSLQ